MTASKTALTGGSLAFALLFGGGLYLFMNLSGIAERYIEKIATETLGVRVSIGKLDLSLQDRRAVVHNLKIANPSGFKNKDALTVSKISVTLGNVSKELITFKDISVDKTNVYLEVKEGGTNLSKIKNQIKVAPAKAESESQAPKVILKRTAITGAQLHPTITLLKEQDLKTVSVPDIILTGIGEKQNGILAREAIAQVFQGVMKKVNAAAGNAGFFQGMSAEGLKDIGRSQVNQVKDQILNDVKDATGSVGDSIKGIFGD